MSEKLLAPDGWEGHEELYHKAYAAYYEVNKSGYRTLENFEKVILKYPPRAYASATPVLQGHSISTCCGVSWDRKIPEGTYPDYIVPSVIPAGQPLPAMPNYVQHVVIRDKDSGDLLIQWKDL